MFKFIYLITTYFLFYFQLYSFDLSSNYRVKAYGSRDGLSHNITTSVIQDSTGFIWVGTYSGLNRFDGHSIRVYNMKNGLVYDSIRALVESPNGSIWIGTEQGLSVYKDGAFKNYESMNGLVHNNIRSLAVDQTGAILIGTVEGFSIFKDNKFLNLTKKDGLISDYITCVFVDSNNSIWLGTNKGIHTIVDYKVSKSEKIEDELSGVTINSINQDVDGSILIATKSKGIYRVKKNEIYPESSYQNIQFPVTSQWYIYKNRSGKLIFVSPNNGLYIHHKNGYAHINRSKGLEGGETVFVDKEDNYWISTFGMGLIKVYPQKVFKLNEENGLEDSNIRYIFKDNSGKIWLGGQSSIMVYEKEKLKVFASNKESVISKVRAIVQDNSNKVWFGTGEGLLYYDGSSIKTHPITEQLSKKSIYSIAFFKDKILIAIEDGNLFEFDPAKNQLNKLTIPNEIQIGFIWQVKADTFEKQVILQGPNGILKYTPQNGFSKFNVIESVQPRRYEKFLYFSDNNYILATDDQIVIHKGTKVDALHLDSIIPSAQVTSLLLDVNGMLWIGTSRGVIRYFNERAVLFDVDDGLAGDNCMFHSILESDSKIYIGSSEGLSIFDVENTPINNVQPSPAISSVHIDHKIYEIQNHKIEIDPENNELQLYFSSLSFTRPDRVKYQYRLEGFSKENEWSPLIDRNLAIYSNLPPKEYTFQVRGTNNDGLMSPNPAQIKIIKKPKFTQTYWFYSIVLFSSLFSLYAFYRYRMAQIKKENERLESLVNQRTKELNSEKEKSDRLLLNILPSEVATELKNKGAAEPRQFVNSTVVFTDFVGFTGISEKMTPSELVRKLDQYFMMFDSILEKYNIEKLKTIGDGYMAAGGIPSMNKTHTVDCILAFLEIVRIVQKKQDATKEYEDKWSLRIGIHTGPIIAGVIGKKKFAYDVWGDTVNTASRLESSGSANRINISLQTYEKVKDFFECEYRGKVSAKGKGTIDMFFIKGILPYLSIDGLGVEPNDEFYKRYEELKLS